MKTSTAPRHFAPKPARSLRNVGGIGKAPAVTNKCRPGNRYSARNNQRVLGEPTNQVGDKVDFLTKIKASIGLRKDQV
jgi:hypothetical protein